MSEITKSLDAIESLLNAADDALDRGGPRVAETVLEAVRRADDMLKLLGARMNYEDVMLKAQQKELDNIKGALHAAAPETIM